MDEIKEESVAIRPIEPVGEVMDYQGNLMNEVYEQGYFATFPVETVEDKKLLYRARNDNELLKDIGDTPIKIVGVVLDNVRVNDEQYGSRTTPCAHLITEDGRVFQSCSTGVVESVGKILSSFGMPDTWEEPLTVVCKETTTARGFRYKSLSVV